MRILKSRPGRKRPPGPSSRDLGLVHYGAGKGDSARNCTSKEFKEAEVWNNLKGDVAGMEQIAPGRSVKVYGTR